MQVCRLKKLNKKNTKARKETGNKLQILKGESHWPRGLRRRSAATSFLGLRVRIPPLALMYIYLL